MSRTLFWYIFWDLLKVFGLASAILTGIMSFGGLLRPLTEHGLGAAQVIKMLAYFWPAMTTYSLPVAALFATAMVYGRLSADNELTACRAAGIPLGIFGVAFPALVLGLVVSAVSFLCLFFIVPVFTLKVEKVIYSNLAQLVENQVERNHRIELTQPGSRPITIFAQSAQVLPPSADRPRDQIVRLTSPTFVRYEPADKSRRDRVAAPLDFFMARSATAFISQDEESGEVYLHAMLDGGIKFPRRTSGSSEQPLQVTVENTTFYSDPMESPVRENTKFMPWTRLQELLREPEKSRRMRRLLNEFIREDQQKAYLQGLAEALQSSDGAVRFDSGAESYVLERYDGTVQVKDLKLSVIAPEGTPEDRLPRFRQVGTGAGALDLRARLTEIRAVPTLLSMQAGASRDKQSPQRRFIIEIDFMDAAVTAGGLTSARSRIPRSFTVPMSERIQALQDNRINDYRQDDLATAGERRNQLDRNWIKLTNSLISEMHARASFSISCCVLVMVGCALGMMFKSGNFLSAFALSVIPAMLSILLIITGQHTCENVPWDVRNYNNPLQFGVNMIWAGNVVVFVLACVLLGRLQRQ